MLSTQPSVHTGCSAWVFQVLPVLLAHVPFRVSTKCNKWEYLQTVATGQNELNVLECPCHKRTSTSWARSDHWVFFREVKLFLIFILLNATCQHSPCLWNDWANVTECHRLLSHPFGHQWYWKLHGCKIDLSLWSLLGFINSIFIHFTEWTKWQSQN